MLFNHHPATRTYANTFTSIDSNHFKRAQALYLDQIVLLQSFLDNRKQLCSKAIGLARFQSVLSY